MSHTNCSKCQWNRNECVTPDVPPDPAAAENNLLDELNRLRDAEVAARNKAAHLQVTLDTELRQKAEAEAAAKLAFDDLDAALELAAESEQQLESEREKFQQRLTELQAKSASAPAEQRKATIAVANQQDAHLDLDEEATRHIIDAQLRKAGWEVDSQTLRYSKGTRPVKRRNIAIAEWPTASGPADYCLFAGLVPIAVLEAKRKRKDVAAAAGALESSMLGITLRLVGGQLVMHDSGTDEVLLTEAEAKELAWRQAEQGRRQAESERQAEQARAEAAEEQIVQLQAEMEELRKRLKNQNPDE